MDDSQKVCVVCSMPLLSTNDYPEGADINVVDWCKYCGTKDSIKTYEEAVNGMTEYMKQAKGLADEDAKKAAEEAIMNSAAFKSGRMVKA